MGTPGPQCSPPISVTSSVIATEMNNGDEGSDAPRRIRITSGPRCTEFPHLSKKASMKISVPGESRKVSVKDLPLLPPLVSSCLSSTSPKETHRRIRVTSGPLCFPVNKKMKIDRHPETLKDALRQAKDKGSTTDQKVFRRCLWLISDINEGVDLPAGWRKKRFWKPLTRLRRSSPGSCHHQRSWLLSFGASHHPCWTINRDRSGRE